MKWSLLLLVCLAARVQADPLRLRMSLQPAETKVVLVAANGLQDRLLGHTGDIYVLPEAALLPHDPPRQLRFSCERYQDEVRAFRPDELLALPPDPDNPGVRIYPPVRMTPLTLYAPAFFLRDNLFWLLPAVLIAAFLGVKRYRASAQESKRLARLERYSAADGDPMLGLRLDQYLLTARLGSGGMATVYRAIPFDTLDESQAVAIKIILDENRDAEFFNRFRREVEVTRSLNHPNTLRLFGWGEQDGLFFMVMELVDGKPLRPPPGGFSLSEFRGYLPGLLAGLRYAHERGIVHRDLKPENLMVMANGQIKVMDFGLARSHDMKTVTATGTALGTPAYMPPEQILGQSPTPLTDQYSLGVTFYEMLCGRRPFEYEDLMALIQAQLKEEAMPLSMYREDVSLELEQVVMQMMCKQPERRFPDLKAVEQALEEAFAAGH